MNNFDYERVTSIPDALKALGSELDSRLIGGGTNLLDLMKEGITRADLLIDINHLDLSTITSLATGGLRLGATATNSSVAYHPEVERRYPLLSEAILAGASPQLRNMATMGGNLLQRTRCYYFYDLATPCNKRALGSGCAALQGVNKIHAILGASEHCIAVHPSDMCIALAALAAEVQITGPSGERTLAFADFHRLPGDRPDLDNNLGTAEIITSIDLPERGFADHYAYVKSRERNSYAFALASAAVALEVKDGRITAARMALGGVAAKPWRRPEIEAQLVGREPNETVFAEAADAVLQGAKGYGHNDFKITLARKVLTRALRQAAERKESL